MTIVMSYYIVNKENYPPEYFILVKELLFDIILEFCTFWTLSVELILNTVKWERKSVDIHNEGLNTTNSKENIHIKTGWPRENRRPVASHWQTLSQNVVHFALIEMRTHISGDRHWLNKHVTNYILIRFISYFSTGSLLLSINILQP
jgi:hypothetical protein